MCLAIGGGEGPYYTLPTVAYTASTTVQTIMRTSVFEPVPSKKDSYPYAGSVRAYLKKYGPLPFEERMMTILTDPNARAEAWREAATNLADLNGGPALPGRRPDATMTSPPKGPYAALARFTNPTPAEAILAAHHVEVEGLMTHFASAGNYQTTQTNEQMALFDRTVDFLREAGIQPRWLHLSSTIPVAYRRRGAWRGMVRPGHAIYGYVAPARGHAPAHSLQVKPALSWRATVLSVKEIPAGALVGYGGMFRAERPMRVAVLAAGYADGIPHRLSNRGSVIVNGKFAPIIGAVSMDLTSIDVTESPQTHPGDAVTLLGDDGGLSIDAQQMAKWAGTISYSVLCGIHARVKRIYV